VRFLKKKKKKKLRSFSHVDETHTHTREDPHPGVPFGLFFFPFFLVARRLTPSRRACLESLNWKKKEKSITRVVCREQNARRNSREQRKGRGGQGRKLLLLLVIGAGLGGGNSSSSKPTSRRLGLLFLTRAELVLDCVLAFILSLFS